MDRHNLRSFHVARPRGIRRYRKRLREVYDRQNRDITTLEGLGTVAKPHPLQAAFIEEQAAQCGYCMNGMIINAKVLLDKNPSPTDDDIKKALDPILCRCGSHLRVIRAIKRAAASASTRAKA